MCWKTRLRAGGILGVLILAPFSLAGGGPRAATLCAEAADGCVPEAGSICWEAGSDAGLDYAAGKP